MSLYVNHVGFTPGAGKRCLWGGPAETDFVVRERASGSVVHTGRLQRAQSDFGVYVCGDFSELREPGTYFIQADRERSHPFAIDVAAYDATLRQMVSYFTLQRCGDTEVGWHGRCHTDDGLRADNRRHQDVEGGWHDANDLRKWVSATLFGMLGLSRLKDVLAPAWDQGQVRDELRWGNRYFLKMQEPAGFIMNHCGGDLYVHADNNRWTDNITDGRDDRTIDTRPCDTISQWVFVLAEAAMAGLVGSEDRPYADRCADAARRCVSWLTAADRTRSAGELGVAMAALVEMHRAAGDGRAIELAEGYASKLLALQFVRQEDSRSPVWGFFLDAWDSAEPPMGVEPFKSIWQGCWPLLGLCELLAYRPDHPQADRWRRAIRLFCENYLEPMTARNAFGIVPFGLYRAKPMGGRRLGAFWYRWFMEPKPEWYVGINANLASAGVGLVKAAGLLGNQRLASLAQRQLDWVLGVNPFDASTVMGAGHNNPQHMFGNEFYPPTPFLPGAVMNGITGTDSDEPHLRPGSYHECEYWTPMVCYTMWLMAELQARGRIRRT